MYTKTKLHRGFTLVEMLVIVPIALLVAIGLISLMVSMVGDVLVSNAEAATIQEADDSLDRINQDTRTSTGFLGSLGPMTSPQGRDGATASFTSAGGDLIVTQYATTASPLQSDRSLVYYANQPNACGDSNIGANATLQLNIIYFLITNPDSTQTLWRRTVVKPANMNGTPDSNTVCAAPFQRNSCPTGSTTNPAIGQTCQTIDEKMADFVKTFSLTYRKADGTITTDPTAAKSVNVQLELAKTVAGKDIDTKRNSVATRASDPPSIAINDGSMIQTINSSNCPSSKVRAVDARDSRTYWVQKLADGKCWMLTNLAYAGGGTNTYSDVKTITNSNTLDYTKAYYMIPTGANATTEPTAPSTSTNGTGQYGYLYNWCAAMGVQTSTSACMNATTPAPDASISICPAGWRLPTSNGGDFTTLNSAVNSGSTSSPSGLLSSWFAQYGGYWYSGFSTQGSNGYYWSSTQSAATLGYGLFFSSASVDPANSSGNKQSGQSVRCIAAI